MQQGLVALRTDDQGRLLCTAHRKSDGEPCNAPVVLGTRVCRRHGASTPQAREAVKRRLADLVDPAIEVLATEMSEAEKSADRQAAANSILDRAGYGRAAAVEGGVARDLLLARLLELAAARQHPTTIEGTFEDEVASGEQDLP